MNQALTARTRVRTFLFATALVGATASGCNTHIVVYDRNDKPALREDARTGTSPGYGAFDVGGTLAFQHTVADAMSLKIGTNLAHSEYDLYYNVAGSADPETFFQAFSNATVWDFGDNSLQFLVSNPIRGQGTQIFPVPPSLSTLSTFGSIGVYVPVATDPTNPPNSTWFSGEIEIVSEGIANLAGIWRMDHGACSTEIPYSTLIPTILAQIGSQFADTQNPSVLGFSYVSHPTTAAPENGNTGGILLHISGTVTSDTIASQGGILGTFGQFFEGFQDVDFSMTLALQLGLDSQGLLSVSFPKAPVINTVCDNSSGSLCEGDAVSSTIRSKLNPTATAEAVNTQIKDCQAVPVPVSGLFGGTNQPKACDPSKDIRQTCKSLIDELTTGFEASATSEQVIDGSTDTVSGMSTDVSNAAIAALPSHIVCKAVSSQCVALTHATASSQAVCQVQLGAGRLNMYPDSAELSWFDEVEKVLPNRQDEVTVALATAAETLGMSAAIGQLCQPPPTNPPSLASFPPLKGRKSVACYWLPSQSDCTAADPL